MKKMKKRRKGRAQMHDFLSYRLNPGDETQPSQSSANYSSLSPSTLVVPAIGSNPRPTQGQGTSKPLDHLVYCDGLDFTIKEKDMELYLPL